MSDEIRQLHQAVQTAEDTLYVDRNQLRTLEYRLAKTRRAGNTGAGEAAELEQAIDALQQTIAGRRDALAGLRGQLAGRTGELVLPKTPQQLAGELNDDVPILLLPVRIETRFMRAGDGTRELWVRVFPDDVAVHTHEKTLTRDEAAAGIAYWTAMHRLAGLQGEEKEARKKAAWRLLAEPYGGARAGWIARELERVLRERHPDFDLSFLEHAGDLDDVLRDLGFDPDAFKADSWSRAPRSTVMPDRFVLVGVTGEQRLELPFPGVVPNPLILGPNPQELESELGRQDGELLTGGDFAWICRLRQGDRNGPRPARSVTQSRSPAAASTG